MARKVKDHHDAPVSVNNDLEWEEVINLKVTYPVLISAIYFMDNMDKLLLNPPDHISYMYRRRS